jgi:hypothetical protein
MSRIISRQRVEGQPVEDRPVDDRAPVDDRYAGRDDAGRDYSNGDYVADRRVHEERWSISPARIIGGIVGIVYIVFGIIGTVRAGIDSTMNRPVVHVGFLDMSAAVAVGILIAGLLLLLGASSFATTPLIGAVGVLSLAAGIVGLAATASWMLKIGAARNVGWFLLIGGAICIAAMFFGTTWVHRRTVRGEVV